MRIISHSAPFSSSGSFPFVPCDSPCTCQVEEVKSKYEAKLAAERELTLRLKGENAIMKKKFSALTKDVEDQKEEIRSLHEKEKELIETIKGLEKDIQGA